MLGFCLGLPLAHVAIYINGAHIGVDHIDAYSADTWFIRACLSRARLIRGLVFKTVF